MSSQKTCKEPGCETPALDQAIFCGAHVGIRRRCSKTRSVDGVEQRCKKQALIGLTTCEKHGGRFPQSQALSKRAVALTAMQRFVTPYEGLLNPISAFEMEFRRCLGRIAWYDEQLGLLASENDLIWGLTKHEKGTSGGGKDNDGVVNVKTYEARVNILEEMQRWERKHLLDLEKVWINAGLERERLDLLRTYAMRTFDLTKTALEALDIDTDDPKVREVLARVFMGDKPTSGPILDVAQIEVHP